MRPPILLIAQVCLFAALSPSLAADLLYGDDDDLCPWTSSDWMLHLDSNPKAPDFWWQTDPLDVEQICICDHGIQFLFTTTQNGEQHDTALVFPKPSRQMLAERLELEPASEILEKEFKHFRGRYTSLLGELDRISGGAVVAGTRKRFQPGAGEGPTIVPNTRLVLGWCGEELKLRGYLDVYFQKRRSVEFASYNRDEPGSDGISLASNSELKSSGSQPRVVPNPGRTGEYMISFAIATAGSVELEIYNVVGQRIATLLSGSQEAGTTRVRWSGRSSRGRAISAGVYFLRLTTTQGVQTSKFVHLGR